MSGRHIEFWKLKVVETELKLNKRLNFWKLFKFISKGIPPAFGHWNVLKSFVRCFWSIFSQHCVQLNRSSGLLSSWTDLEQKLPSLYNVNHSLDRISTCSIYCVNALESHLIDNKLILVKLYTCNYLSINNTIIIGWLKSNMISSDKYYIIAIISGY